MSIKYILGRSGYGKTELCYAEIIKELQTYNSNISLIYIVPEQYSLQAERELVRKTLGSGNIRAQVLSFQRLAYHVFSEEGRSNKKTLEDIGKNMLLRKIVYDLRNELVFFKNTVNKQGFISNLSDTVSEFYKYGITLQNIEQMIVKAEGRESFRLKMMDLYKIFESYMSIIQEGYISGDETLDILEDRIDGSKLLDKAMIWIDGFQSFTPQEYKVLRKLMLKSSRISIALTVDDDKTSYDECTPTDIFYETKRTINKISKIAAENGVPIEKNIFLRNNLRHTNNNELCFFEKRFTTNNAVYEGNVNSIKIFGASNMYKEIEHVANQIQYLVREKEYRYYDIGLVACALPEYEKILNGVFRKYDIPCFIDAKIDILSHPLTELIRAALEVAAKNWSYEGVFRFLKTGMTGIKRDMIDKIENYVLAYGIKGSKWQKEWIYGFESASYESFEHDSINECRSQIVSILLPFISFIKGSKRVTVRQLAVKIFELIQKLGVKNTLDQWIEAAVQNKDTYTYYKHSQIWGRLVRVFEKMVEILGEEQVTAAQFAKIVDAGLEIADMGMIPPSQDRVIVGDLERSRLPNIKALFVLGMNDGVIPSRNTEEGLLSDDDRALFEREHLELAQSAGMKAFSEQLLIYLGLVKPSELLFLSYYKGDTDGNGKQSSTIIGRVKKLFSSLEEEKEGDSVISGAKAEFGALSGIIRKYAQSGEISDTYKDVYNWYLENLEYKEKLSDLEGFLFNISKDEKLSKETLKRLYKGKILTTGVSRLEKYVECPFAYFVTYNLRAKERRLYQMEAVDLGTVFHGIIENFFTDVIADNADIRLMDKSEIYARTKQSIEKLGAEELKNKSDLMAGTKRYGYYMSRIEKISQRTIWALSSHIKQGEFEPTYNEMEFSQDEDSIVVQLDDGIMVLTGKIDRVDILQSDGFVKIIDYKSGAHQLDLEKIYYGRQLQLMIYMDAVLRKLVGVVSYEGEGAKPAAVLYFRIDNPIIEYEGELDSEKIDEGILKKFKMSGIVMRDKKVVQSIDNSIKVSSSIIPVTLVKGEGKNEKVVKETKSTVNAEDFDLLLKYVSKKAKSLGENILSGDISARPFKHGTQTGCDYCAYGGICQFDTADGKYNMFNSFESYIDVLNEIRKN